MMTMEMLADKYYYMDVWELWDEVAEHPDLLGATDREVAEVFAGLYKVDVEEVMTYFCCED